MSEQASNAASKQASNAARLRSLRRRLAFSGRQPCRLRPLLTLPCPCPATTTARHCSCEKAPNSDIDDIDKKKYLVPADLTVGQFIYVIRKRIKINSEKSLFMFVNGKIPPTARLMSMVYEENKNEDGFLYITYSGENTFGCC